MQPPRSQCDISVVAVSDVGLLPEPKFKMRISHTLFMYTDYRHIHIGSIIKARIKACGMTYTEFARQLCIERTTVYNILRSKSIDTERLIKIGGILGYDFLRNVYIPENSRATGQDIKIEINGKEIQTDLTTAESIKITITTKDT